ncbi:hypothetical protein [Niallia taxi]|uniref:hypothetical protein n=1 Tax=Niallia taxi TaxID=2499688 RepID=UPI003D2AB77C
MQFYSVKEVAIKLGLSIKTIENMCEKGRFKDAYQTDNDDWLIPGENFITSREQFEKANEILQHIDRKNQEVDKSELLIDANLVAIYYETTLNEVKQWIKKGIISGKTCEENSEIYLVSKEEFEYLKSKREYDDTDKTIAELLGDGFTDWDLEIDD